nr:PREDICTED: uncharacterized protein LOC106703055 [Latimeria chalumnae]|eukprot:XP_014342523.1 PREDICTED: uncharacterized protein LOC106703055 [Latimeria chalumnae]
MIRVHEAGPCKKPPATSTRDPALQEMMEVIGELRSELAQLKEAVRSQAVEAPNWKKVLWREEEPWRPPGPRRRPLPNRDKYEDQRCWHCGGLDHWRAECPQRGHFPERRSWSRQGLGGQSLAWKPKGPKAETVMAHTTGRGYYLTGEIEGIPCRFLVDSGAQVSVAHLQLWKNVTGKGPEDLTPFNGVINVANGGELQVLGTWRTMISLGNLQLACEFLVSEEATQDVLVGTDFLKQYGAALDFRECTCTLLGRKFALMTGEDVGLCRVSGTALTLEASQLVRNSKNEVEETESLSMKDCQRADSQLSRLRG